MVLYRPKNKGRRAQEDDSLLKYVALKNSLFRLVFLCNESHKNNILHQRDYSDLETTKSVFFCFANHGRRVYNNTVVYNLRISFQFSRIMYSNRFSRPL